MGGQKYVTTVSNVTNHPLDLVDTKAAGNTADGDGCDATCAVLDSAFICPVEGEPCVLAPYFAGQSPTERLETVKAALDASDTHQEAARGSLPSITLEEAV